MLRITSKAFFPIRKDSTSRKLLLGKKKKKNGFVSKEEVQQLSSKDPTVRGCWTKAVVQRQRILFSPNHTSTPLRGSAGITTPATSSCQASAENCSQMSHVIIVHYEDQSQQKSLQSPLNTNRMWSLWKAYLYIFKCQDIFHIPLGYFHLGGYATDSTDHIIVIPDR